jgi:hypothetical protein
LMSFVIVIDIHGYLIYNGHVPRDIYHCISSRIS